MKNHIKLCTILILMSLLGNLTFAQDVEQEARNCSSIALTLAINKKFTEAIKIADGCVLKYPNASTAYVNRGAVYMDSENLDKAMADFNKAVQLNPKNIDAYTHRGDVFLTKKQYAEALTDFTKAISLVPDEEYAYYRRGVTHQLTNKTALALADYNKAIEISKKGYNMYIYYNEILRARGLMFTLSGNYPNALNDFNEAIRFNVNDQEAYRRKVSLYQITMNADSALATQLKLTAVSSEAEDWADLGDMFKSKKDFAGAQMAYTGALGFDKNNEKAKKGLAEVSPTTAEGMVKLGNQLLRDNKLDNALEKFNAAIKLDSKYTNAYIGRGRVYQNRKNFPLALNDLNKAVSLNPASADAFDARAYVYQLMQDYPKAIADLTKAISLQLTGSAYTLAGTYLSRANVYREWKKNELAIADYNLCISTSSKDSMAKYILEPDAHYYLAVIYESQQQKDLAIAEYKKTLALNAKYESATTALKRLGAGATTMAKTVQEVMKEVSLYAQQKEFDKAINTLTDAIKLAPKEVTYYVFRAKINSSRNNYPTALADYEFAQKLNPKEPGIFYYRGVTYMKMGRKNEAIQDMRQVLVLKPGDPKATEALKQLGVAP